MPNSPEALKLWLHTSLPPGRTETSGGGSGVGGGGDGGGEQ